MLSQKYTSTSGEGIPNAIHLIPSLMLKNRLGTLNTQLNIRQHVIVILAFLLVLKEAALCGFIML